MPGKLTALAVTRAKERGTYGDGGGLYLQVARGGTKSWILRYKRDGKTRHLGLGPVVVVSLREARQRAIDARRLAARRSRSDRKESSCYVPPKN